MEKSFLLKLYNDKLFGFRFSWPEKVFYFIKADSSKKELTSSLFCLQISCIVFLKCLLLSDYLLSWFIYKGILFILSADFIRIISG